MSQESGRIARCDQGFKHLLVALGAVSCIIIFLGQAREHAPAASIRPGRAEEFHQIIPMIGREGKYKDG
jgi:hypothetical protein